MRGFAWTTLWILLAAPLGQAQEVLVLQEPTGAQISSQAATALGYTVTVANDEGEFFAALCPTGPCNNDAWDLLVVELPNATIGDDVALLISDFVQQGGLAIVSYGALDSNNVDGTLLRDALEISSVISYTNPLPVHAWVAAHPIWSQPQVVSPPLQPTVDVTLDDGDRLEPAVGAEALGGFLATVTPNEAAIVLGNQGTTFCNGFAYDNYAMADVMPLIQNQIAFLLGGSGPDTDFVRGDCNGDGSSNIADVVFFLGAIFPSGPPTPLPCIDACDANDDGSTNIADAVAALEALFGVPATPLPAPAVCGTDPTPDALDCGVFATCP